LGFPTGWLFTTHKDSLLPHQLTTSSRNYYKLEPNGAFCGKYGSRMYLVIASKDEGLYTCECAKMEQDGLLCCHILKMFTHLGVDRYLIGIFSGGGHKRKSLDTCHQCKKSC
jgi:hypothetical protein